MQPGVVPDSFGGCIPRTIYVSVYIMRTLSLAVVVVILCGVSSAAQTVTTYQVPGLAEPGVITTFLPINTDGDEATIELLVSKTFSFQKRVIAIRHGQVCAGPWFTVDDYGGWSLQKLGRVHVFLRVRGHGDKTEADVLHLHTPSC